MLQAVKYMLRHAPPGTHTDKYAWMPCFQWLLEDMELHLSSKIVNVQASLLFCSKHMNMVYWAIQASLLFNSRGLSSNYLVSAIRLFSSIIKPYKYEYHEYGSVKTLTISFDLERISHIKRST